MEDLFSSISTSFSASNSQLFGGVGTGKLSVCGIGQMADGRFGYLTVPIFFIDKPALMGGVKQK